MGKTIFGFCENKGKHEVYTKEKVDELLGKKAGTSHTHDDRYYTETEVNKLLTNKAEASHTHDSINPRSAGQLNTPVGNGQLIVKRASNSEAPNNGVVLEYGTSKEWGGQLYIGDNAYEGVSFNGWADGVRGEWKKLGWHPVTLYSSASGTTGTVTLSESASNFTYIEIFYNRKSEKVSVNNGKANLIWATSDNSCIIFRSADYEISGTKISRLNETTYNTYDRTARSSTDTTIYKVLGYR